MTFRVAGTYSALEMENLVVRQGIGLGDHRDQVDLGVQPAHDLNVQRLQGMAGGLDKVDASVDAVVDDVRAVDLILGLQIRVAPLLDVLHDGAPRVVVVHKVTESGSVDDGQAKADAVLLDVRTDGLDRHGLGDDIVAGTGGFFRGIERGIEERVHESRLAQSRFTCRAS